MRPSPRPSIGLAGAAIALVACGSSHPPPKPLVLRVSTHWGLAPMSPDPAGTMTAHLVSLVYEPLATRFATITHDGAQVFLTPRHDVATLEELAARVVHPALVSARADGDRIVAEFASAEAAGGIRLDSPMLDEGPYEQVAYTQDRLVLKRRRAGVGPEVIEVENMDSEEEWRRFLGREVDLLATASPAQIKFLAEVPSVRVREFAHAGTLALFFNVREDGLHDARIRRAIATALRRRPLAANVVGSADAAVELEEDLQAARQLLADAGVDEAHPLRIRLLEHDSGVEMQRAALIIEQQLALVGVDVRLEALPIDEFAGRLARHDFDVAVLYGGLEPRHFYRVLSASPANVTGYASAEFDALVARGDVAGARRRLLQDVPVTPLFLAQESMAIDRALCGADPQYTSDLAWLAAVHRCEQGESE